MRSGERAEWTVKVWTDEGESEWAQPSWWEMGLLEADDWVARWVEPPGAEEETGRPSDWTGRYAHPVWLVRGTAVLDRPGERARAYVTALGVYEFFVNGHRVGDAELTPGFTSYGSRLQVYTFDVTDLVVAGENVFAAVLSGGWVTWSPRYRDTPVGLLAQVNVHHPDGSVTRVGTGDGWVAGTGETQTADLQQGQVADLRKRRPGWSEPGADPSDWSAVRVKDYDPSSLVGPVAPPVRRVQELRPVAVTRPRAGCQIVDLGQNINGWVRLRNLGPAGTRLVLTHGEALDAQGDLDTGWVSLRAGVPLQQDEVVSAGCAGEEFEPRHTTHGFQYVRIEGHPDELTADDVTGVVVHTDLRRTGWFECSDERINKLHDAAVWSFRGNACDIPTDCPTRERAGWTGDWQVFVSTAAFLYDVAGFSTKWLSDLAAEQHPNGVVRNFAPNPFDDEFEDEVPSGSSGWGDATVIVPWETYQAYGDRDLLAQQWNSMTAWVDYAARTAREHRHESRIAARPTPAPYEQSLWDTGFHFGEWHEPGFWTLSPDTEWSVMKAFVLDHGAGDHGAVATAYLHYSAVLLTRVAQVLGRDDDAERYGALAVATRDAWQAEFLHPDGTITPHTQASYVRALEFDLVPDELRPLVTEHLVELIRKADNHLGTGFLATPYLLSVLADAGRADVAYELLFQDTEPSWLVMINRGATTIWELWDGIDADGTACESLNHYSKGAVISFLHRRTAGIQLLPHSPAYRRFRIAPMPGGGIMWAKAAHDSPYGRIESAWRIDRETFTLDVVVPPGTTAEIVLPDGHTADAYPGRARYTCEL